MGFRPTRLQRRVVIHYNSAWYLSLFELRMRKPGRADGLFLPTVEDVAVAAGVSTATVSRALRMPERVSPDLRRRVEGAVARLRYVPNASAKALSTLRTGVVAIVVADLIRNAALISSVIARLASYGFGARVAECGAGGAADALHGADADVEGVIVLGVAALAQTHDMPALRRVPWVEVTANQASPSPGVLMDLDVTAATAAVYLRQSGHRAAVLLSDPVDTVTGHAWMKALAGALPAAGMLVQACAVLADLMPIAERMRASTGRMAVLCASDLLAMEAASALSRAGFDVPGGASCVGWGDEPFAARLSLPMATVRVPWQMIGEGAVDALLGIRGGKAGRQVRVVPKLVIRKSILAPDVSRETMLPGST